MLELLTGRRAVDLTLGPSDQNLVLQVRHILNDKKKLRKVIDPELSRSSYTMESITMFANLASRCVRTDSSERPSMVDCIKELQLILHTNTKGLNMTMHTFRMIWDLLDWHGWHKIWSICAKKDFSNSEVAISAKSFKCTLERAMRMVGYSKLSK